MAECTCPRLTLTGNHNRDCPAWNAIESATLVLKERLRRDMEIFNSDPVKEFEGIIERIKVEAKPWCSICNIHHDMETPCIQNGKEIEPNDHKYYGKRPKKKR